MLHDCILELDAELVFTKSFVVEVDRLPFVVVENVVQGQRIEWSVDCLRHLSLLSSEVVPLLHHFIELCARQVESRNSCSAHEVRIRVIVHHE